MDIRPIKTEADYDWALAEIAPYFEREPEPGSPEADRFDVLASLIEAYENRHWAVEAPDPVDTIKTFMEMHNRSQGDLAELLGSKSRASEVLNGDRRLSLDMIHRLSTKWHISADLLVRPYSLSGRAGGQRKSPHAA